MQGKHGLHGQIRSLKNLPIPQTVEKYPPREDLDAVAGLPRVRIQRYRDVVPTGVVFLECPQAFQMMVLSLSRTLYFDRRFVVAKHNIHLDL